jgi:hypothetical protein
MGTWSSVRRIGWWRSVVEGIRGRRQRSGTGRVGVGAWGGQGRGPQCRSSTYHCHKNCTPAGCQMTMRRQSGGSATASEHACACFDAGGPRVVALGRGHPLVLLVAVEGAEGTVVVEGSAPVVVDVGRWGPGVVRDGRVAGVERAGPPGWPVLVAVPPGRGYLDSVLAVQTGSPRRPASEPGRGPPGGGPGGARRWNCRRLRRMGVGVGWDLVGFWVVGPLGERGACAPVSAEGGRTGPCAPVPNNASNGMAVGTAGRCGLCHHNWHTW